jgi:amino acid transporter
MRPLHSAPYLQVCLQRFGHTRVGQLLGYIGGEVKDQYKNIPRGITIGVFIIITTYLLVNTAYLSLLPVDTLEHVYKSQNMVAAIEAVKVFWGENGGLFISTLIAGNDIGMHTCNNSCELSYLFCDGEARNVFSFGKQIEQSTGTCQFIMAPGNLGLHSCIIRHI